MTINNQKLTQLGLPFSIANSKADRKRIHQFGQKEYHKFYPKLKQCFQGKYDKNACILYTETSQGELISTARIVFDGSQGLPNDKLIKKHLDWQRAQGKRLMEVGEFVITDSTQGLLERYYRAFYEIALNNDIDYMLILVKQKDVAFHQSMIGAKVLVESNGHTYGSGHYFSYLEWSIKDTKPAFFEWTKTPTKDPYPVKEWDEYAKLHASIMTSQQLALFNEACSYLDGDIIDCGCGTAKLAPLLADDNKVHSYTGVDYSKEMVSVAQHIIEHLGRQNFHVQFSKIEDVNQHYNAAVSIHSYYAWLKPLDVLSHIFQCLTNQSIFVLATPNKHINQAKLLKEAEKELIAHPHFEAFKNYNLKIEANPKANFISMDELIKQVQKVGFKVLNCHQKHYNGGVNFLVLQK